MSSTSGFVLKQETTPLVETVTGVTGYPFGGEYYPYQTTQVVKTTGCGVGCTGGMPTTTVVETATTPFNTFKYVVDVLNVAEDSYLTGHQIDGRVLYPTTGYLYLVWKSLAKLNGFTSVEQMPITFENVEIHRATILALEKQIPTKQIEFCVRIVPKTGFFELVEGENVIVTGRVSIHESIAKLEQLKMLVHQHLSQLNERKRLVDLLEQEEIYRELRMRGYEYKGEFQPLLKADLEGTCGELLWTGKWIPFLDAMLQLNTLQQRRTVGSGLVLPTRIRMIRIDPFAHYHMQKLITKMVKSVSLPTFRTVVGGVERPYVLPVVFEPLTSRIVCGGVEIVGVNTTGVQSWTPMMTTPIVSPVERVERSGVFVPQSFVPYVEKHFDEEYVIVDKLGESEPVFRQNREFLEFYLNECKRYVSHILRKIEQPSFVQQTIVPTVVPRTLEQQLEALKIVPTTTVVPSTVYGGEFLGTPYGKLLESGKLLQLLTYVANIESTDGQYLYKIQKIFAEKFAYLKALEEDVILNLVNNRSYYLKSILDTVLENTHHIYNMGGVVPRTTTETYIPRLKVLEISPSVGHFFGAKVSNLMKLYPNRIGQIDYHYVPSMVGVHPTTVVPEEYIMELNKQLPYEIKKIEWNFGLKNGKLITEVPSHLREYDLVILNGGLSSLLPYVESEYELKKWLQTVVMEKVLKPQGFLFVHEYTNSFDLLSQLNKLEQSTVLSTPTMLSQLMTTPFKYTTGRFPYQKYQSEMQWRQLIEECGFYPVSMKSDVELSSMFLYRRPLSVTLPVCEEKILIDEYVAEQSREWIKRVRCALLEKQIERVWLLSEREPTFEIVSMINQLRREIGGEKIRCLFVADRQPVNFYGTRYMVPSIAEFVQMPVQVAKEIELFNVIRKADLIMNVFRQGQWGSFRPIVNLRKDGLYPTTTVFPFVTGSTLPYPTLSTFERRFAGEKPWTTTGHMTHLPIGYPFEFPVENTTGIQTVLPTTRFERETIVPTTRFERETIVPRIVERETPPTTRFVERETIVPTTRFERETIVPTTRFERETIVPRFVERETLPTTRFVERETVPSCFEREIVEPVVFPSTQVRSVVYRRQHQLTTTTSSQQVLTTLPTQKVILNPLQTYIITCGLSAFGLELLEWAVEHGARRVILTSKYGVRTGYQARKLRILRDEFNAQIQVLPVDIREEAECMTLIKEAIQMSVEQKIGGIFHLAATVEDFLFEEKQFPVHEILKQIAEYRIQGAYNLDKLTRCEAIMDEMSYFVVYSSFLTTMVTPTVIEKICESRRRFGKHALAIHLGCNIECGLFVEKMLSCEATHEPCHLVLSRIFYCLKAMETLMLKSIESTTMWSHFIPVEHYWMPEVYNTTTTLPMIQTPYMKTMLPTTTVVPQYKSLAEVLLTVLGIRDINRICEQTVTLGELGLDTVLAQELRQLFEQVYQFPVQIREIPQLTVEKIRMIESRYPQGINELYLPRPLTYLPRLRSVIRKTIF